MIQLDVDLQYLTKHFQVNTKRLFQSGNKSIDQIMEAEAAQGNKSAAKFDLELLRQPRELLKAFRLTDANNRYKILKNLNHNDLSYVVQFLEKDDLVLGLKFFTKSKLLTLVNQLPKEKILKVVFDMFSPQKLLKLIPERSLDKFLGSDKINKTEVFKIFQTFQPAQLSKMIESVTGKKVKNQNTQEMLKTIEGFSPAQFKEGMQSLKYKQKLNLIFNLTKKDAELYKEFKKADLMRPLDQTMKGNLIGGMGALENEDLTKMLENLPDNLLSIVATQIDPAVFADILVKYYQETLSQIAVG